MVPKRSLAVAAWPVFFLLVAVMIVPTASSAPSEWQVLAEDVDGQGLPWQNGDGPNGRADLSRVLLDPGDGDGFQLAVETHARLADAVVRGLPDYGEFLYHIFFELRALTPDGNGGFVAGPASAFRVTSLLTSYTYGDSATFRFISGGNPTEASYLDGEEVSGIVEQNRLIWSLDRRTDFEEFRNNLPLDKAWEIGSVFAEARPIHGGPLADATLEAVVPLYDTYDPLRTDRAPDSTYGSRGVIPAAAPAEDPRPLSDPVTFDGDSSAAQAAATFAGAGVVGLFALLWYVWRRMTSEGIAFWSFGLFSRIARPKALDHDRRRLVCEGIQANPGITFGKLRNLTELGSGPLAHHLKILEQNRLVVVRRVSGKRYYYVAGGAAATKTPPADDVLTTVEGAPASTPAQVAQTLGRPRSTVAARLRFWERLGRVRSERDGRVRRYFPG